MFTNIMMVIVIAAIVATMAVHFIDLDESDMDKQTKESLDIKAKLKLKLKHMNTEQVLKIAIESLGVGIGLVILKHVALRHPEFSWLCLIILVTFIIGLMYQWHKQGSDPGEFVCFTALTLIAGGIACVAAANYASATIIPLLAVILLSIFAIGFYGFTAFKFYREINMLDDDERAELLEKKKNDTVKEMDKKVGRFNRLMAAVAVATLIALAGTTGVVLGMADSGYFKGGPDLSANVEKTTIAMTDTVNAATDTKTKSDTKTTATNWHYYNNDVQGGNAEDDFNFGPVPKADTATEYDKDFRKRLENDPALGAADMAWADAWLGTRYLGEFYESCNKDWSKTINAAKEAWIKDPEAYKATLDAFFLFLNTAEVKVTAGSGLEDQMYMNPYTVDGTPDVIVLATPDHTGKFLTYYFTIKGTGKVKVSYRVECGYQPTNVEEIMGITPQTKPSNPGNTPGKGDNPTPTPTPTPKPTPTPSYSKNPSEDPVNKGNAQKGGGQNKSTDGSGENQPVDPRTEHPTGSGNDNNHGYSDPSTVTPSNPSSTKSEPVVTDSNPMDYKPDPVTNNGPTDSSKKPTSSGGDGEFTPSD